MQKIQTTPLFGAWFNKSIKYDRAALEKAMADMKPGQFFKVGDPNLVIAGGRGNEPIKVDFPIPGTGMVLQIVRPDAPKAGSSGGARKASQTRYRSTVFTSHKRDSLKANGAVVWNVAEYWKHLELGQGSVIKFPRGGVEFTLPSFSPVEQQAPSETVVVAVTAAIAQLASEPKDPEVSVARRAIHEAVVISKAATTAESAASKPVPDLAVPTFSVTATMPPEVVAAIPPEVQFPELKEPEAVKTPSAEPATAEAPVTTAEPQSGS